MGKSGRVCKGILEEEEGVNIGLLTDKMKDENKKRIIREVRDVILLTMLIYFMLTARKYWFEGYEACEKIKATQIDITDKKVIGSMTYYCIDNKLISVEPIGDVECPFK